VNDQLYWSTGKEASELDLAGLVCNLLPPEKGCINPKRGQSGGQTWEMRQKIVERVIDEIC
jgi:hypothetical protein